MGRELQKKKNRSSISKVKHKTKSKKRLLHHPIVAENWDKSLTFAQNYARLGLTAKLNKSTGGTEKKVSDVQREADGEWNGFSATRDPLNIASTSRRNEKLDVTEAKIERDPVTGEILRIVEQGAAAKANPLNDPLNDLDSDDSSDGEELLSLRNQHGNTDKAVEGAASGKTETVRRLEAAANRPVQKYKRRQPEGEVAFIEELVAKYGDDYGKMARDTKINYMQRSEGDLKKRIKKWRESGGKID